MYLLLSKRLTGEDVHAATHTGDLDDLATPSSVHRWQQCIDQPQRPNSVNLQPCSSMPVSALTQARTCCVQALSQLGMLQCLFEFEKGTDRFTDSKGVSQLFSQASLVLSQKLEVAVHRGQPNNLVAWPLLLCCHVWGGAQAVLPSMRRRSCRHNLAGTSLQQHQPCP